MEITSGTAQYSVLKKDEECGKILGNVPTVFQIRCDTLEESKKVVKMIEALL